MDRKDRITVLRSRTELGENITDLNLSYSVYLNGYTLLAVYVISVDMTNGSFKLQKSLESDDFDSFKFSVASHLINFIKVADRIYKSKSTNGVKRAYCASLKKKDGLKSTDFDWVNQIHGVISIFGNYWHSGELDQINNSFNRFIN